MKHTRIVLSLIIGSSLITSCGNGDTKDAKEKADSTNSAKIDTAKAKDTSASNPVHMADLKQDAEFAVEAADGGMLEVALGKLAVKMGTSSAVKKLGAQMVTDHSKANLELKALAAEKHITIPSAMSEKCQKEVSDLEAKTGKDFNKAYADLMVKDHKDDIDLFKKEAKDGNDSQISNWAKNTIPVLDHHLMMAEDVQKGLNK